MSPLLTLLTGHFVADFVLQSNQMATLKSKSWTWLCVHVWVYTCALLPFAAFARIPLVAFWVVTFVSHFATDAVTSRITSRLWFVGTSTVYPEGAPPFQAVVGPPCG